VVPAGVSPARSRVVAQAPYWLAMNSAMCLLEDVRAAVCQRDVHLAVVDGCSGGDEAAGRGVHDDRLAVAVEFVDDDAVAQRAAAGGHRVQLRRSAGYPIKKRSDFLAMLLEFLYVDAVGRLPEEIDQAALALGMLFDEADGMLDQLLDIEILRRIGASHRLVEDRAPAAIEQRTAGLAGVGVAPYLRLVAGEVLRELRLFDSMPTTIPSAVNNASRFGARPPRKMRSRR
jgi:hypothetical protein